MSEEPLLPDDDEDDEEIETLPPQAIEPTPDTFGMLYAAVLNVQRTQVAQITRMKTYVANQNKKEEKDSALVTVIADLKALNKFGAALMLVMAGGMGYLLLEIHKLEVLIAGLRR